MATGLHSVTSRIVRAAATALLWSLALGAPAQTVRYIHTDALGSVAVVTDQNRNVIERREYEPYGFQLTPVIKDGPGYTGHVQDAVTGLTYMQQRYYDPQIGRFLSIDPVTAHVKPGANFNRYWYANNNPYRFTDPDGRCPMPGSSLCGKPLETIQAQDAAQYRGETTLLGKIAGFALDFTPWFGDVKGVLEAVDDPSATKVMAAAIGLFGPVGDGIGKGLKHADEMETAADFFAGTRYSEKVLGQMKAGDLHSFPESVKGFKDSGAVRKIVGGDGVTRDMLEIPGEYKGKTGNFEFMKESDGEINHRFFRPDRQQ
ncbi:RHS repeat domain-containing protein [Pseudoxanthomonas sp. UTMC 1351]|uniref:RHS repeat domain-containing protein n=1 Tax=Pseudoxanthomonas sp. UTMC 1351 TaxID=2695853 RepID=UPI0034CE3041